MKGQPILEVREVTKTFGGIIALNRVSFDVGDGEILGIIGPNGSGKTTVVNCITGFVKASSGRILFRGRDITGMRPHRIADMGVTRTFQIMRPYYSLPAFKNLVIPLFSPRARRTGGWRGGGMRGRGSHPSRGQPHTRPWVGVGDCPGASLHFSQDGYCGVRSPRAWGGLRRLVVQPREKWGLLKLRSGEGRRPGSWQSAVWGEKTSALPGYPFNAILLCTWCANTELL